MNQRLVVPVALAVVLSISTSPLAAAAKEESGVDQAKYERIVTKGIEYLTTKGQSADGSFSKFAGIGPTALATMALLRHGRGPEDPAVAKSLAFLQKHVQPDGGIYAKGSNYRNYETCLAVVCFAAANKDNRYDKLIKKADAYLKGIQWDGSEGKDKSDPAFGGAGYGKNKRPDLSNTAFLIEALKAAGNDADSEAMKRALVFVSRCQNLESEHNTTPFAAKINDGGFYYSPVVGDASRSGDAVSGGLRSYGAMTYAGLKSMIYAGVDKEDPRVKAAVSWIKKNYGLDSNPGMGKAGLYYYYHTFAKSLAAVGVNQIATTKGAKRDWRADLIAELAIRQQPNGSWVNTENTRWLEGDPNLVTAFSLLALRHCRPQQPVDSPPQGLQRRTGR